MCVYNYIHFVILILSVIVSYTYTIYNFSRKYKVFNYTQIRCNNNICNLWNNIQIFNLLCNTSNNFYIETAPCFSHEDMSGGSLFVVYYLFYAFEVPSVRILRVKRVHAESIDDRKNSTLFVWQFIVRSVFCTVETYMNACFHRQTTVCMQNIDIFITK